MREYTIPEGTYEGVPETKTVAVSAVVVARDDVSEEDVYNIVYTIFENMDNIAQSHDKGQGAESGLRCRRHRSALSPRRGQVLC